MCFVHSGSAGGGSLIQQTALGAAAATAFSTLAAGGGAVGGMDVTASGSPDVVAGPGGTRVLDGYGQILHTRWNRDLPPAATVRPGEVIQLLCRDALDIGEAARTLTPEASLALDLARVHPLTGPIEVEGAEPGDILEVEILDVAPLVDFGYVVIGPALGMFGSLRPDVLAPITQFTEPSQISDPNPGPVPGAIPEDQPYNSGSPFVQLFTFERGQNTGFATFVGADTGRQARIPVAPFMGIYGVAPMRKGMYRTLPPGVSGAMGGNADIRQFTKGARIQFPVYAPGAKFSAGDGHMAQGDGEVCVTAIETLMAVTLRFGVIKNSVIASPRAIVPAADPTQLAMPAEMLAHGYYHTTGIGPDLMENAKNAVRDMVDWLVTDQQLSLHEAYALCSVAGDLKISETVDLPNWVVSMTLPRGIFAA
ncbi:MAG TPA: acetamidase/formamidase family protein [Streptosporangiaceae bacterium]|nr:acetamidase/formamidase family protein [Streptosporangiaceae bacterium]